jgi:hypothetical protein
VAVHPADRRPVLPQRPHLLRPADQAQILARCREVLRPDGYLLLGGSETTLNIDDRYERVSQAPPPPTGR